MTTRLAELKAAPCECVKCQSCDGSGCNDCEEFGIVGGECQRCFDLEEAEIQEIENANE